MITILILHGLLVSCEEAETVPVGGAAQDLRARFAEMFEDSEDAEKPEGFGGFEGYDYGIAGAAAETVQIIQIEEGEEPLPLTPPLTKPAAAHGNTGYEADYYILPIITWPSEHTAETTAETDEIEPAEPEPAVPVALFVVTPTGRRFHLERCHHARNVAQLLTREEAEARGFEPCRVCNP